MLSKRVPSLVPKLPFGNALAHETPFLVFAELPAASSEQ
jgi:hypothetical protein